MRLTGRDRVLTKAVSRSRDAPDDGIQPISPRSLGGQPLIGDRRLIGSSGHSDPGMRAIAVVLGIDPSGRGDARRRRALSTALERTQRGMRVRCWVSAGRPRGSQVRIVGLIRGSA